ncbi:MAG: inositol monophosphatase family protein [Nitrospiria bacterium]
MVPTKPVVDVKLIRDWLKEAGQIALSQWADRIVDIKADLTPVTQIDRQVEDFLLEQIERTYPGHGILAEEGSIRSGKDFTWIIDPIDGTRAFASGLPVWGISVGVFHQGEPYAGAFYMPATGEMYWGSQEEAYCNERKLVPWVRVDLNSSLAFIAVPSNAHLHFDISFPRLRSLGSVTAHLAYVAHGKATAALTRQIRLWDIAAVLPTLRISQTQLVYLSGETLNPKDLLNGELTPEPLIAAHFSIIDQVRACIELKSAGSSSSVSI